MSPGSHNAKLFINYRRDDTAPYAGRLYDRLKAHFGEEQVFIDIDQIEPGEDFVEAIKRKVGACEIAIVSIGPDWLAATDASGKRRIDDSEDFVRMEIVAALERKIRVIPVLVGGARMPRKQDLPEALAPLSRRNAIELSETRFHADVDRLIEAIEKPRVSSEKTAEPSATPVAPLPEPASVSLPESKELHKASEFPKAAERSRPDYVSPNVTRSYRRALIPIGIALVLGCVVWFLSLRRSPETGSTGSRATVVTPVIPPSDSETVRPLPSPSVQDAPAAGASNDSAAGSNGSRASSDLGATTWNHNGSTVVLRKDGSRRSFQYRQVRPGLQGIVPEGATLFEGVAVGDRYSGKARRFKKGFPMIEYEVSGGILDGGRVIELTGKAPIRDESGTITEYVLDTLRFEHIGSAE